MINLRYSELNFDLLEIEKKLEIQKKAEQILANNNLDSIGFNLIDFLVNTEHFEIKSQYIDDGTTGLLIVDDNQFVQNSNSNRVIIINRNIDEDKEFIQKRRFVSAHEYAHFVLHKKNSKQFARRDERTISIPDKLDEKLDENLIEELEAEYFAYCFLLSEKKIRALFDVPEIREIVNQLQDKGISIVEIVSNLFNVSMSKAKKRLDMLNLL